MKISIGVLALLLAGCSSSAMDQPAHSDWYQLGFKDAIRGNDERSHSTLSSLGAGKESEYDSGYAAGLEQYCNPDRAYQMGLNGQQYQGVCDHKKSGQKFRMEWQRGWRDYNQ
ncbi:DUF2799 domain-containing protein [Vibrio palustris]|uniref:Lipoprotein n=1 Tax=Vibrio palustris TaxID=1918946 RepID=A0A1R4B8N1_9VIBR|nr:DUF2799 domain-containing protein [Vibrio palustris]SJL85285.1 lipoprotein [Vibrio palustris]